jgi:DsbC/DsbD-like thiol-disulfide interchange protein
MIWSASKIPSSFHESFTTGCTTMLVRFGRFGHTPSLVIPCFGLLLRLFFLALASAAAAQSSNDATAVKSARMGLIAAAGLTQGIYHAAAAIELSPLAITYWRQPGEAGVPPRFSFEGSENLGSVEVRYPWPSRLEEGGVEAFGYRGGVVFPIHVTPRDASLPTILKLSLDYAVCQTICIPVRAHAELVLPQRSTDSADEQVETAEARVPLLLTPRDLVAKATIVPEEAATKPAWKSTWTLQWKGDEGLEDLFAEAPEGWYFETHKTSDHEFLIVAVETPSDASAKPVEVRLTAVGAQKAQEVQKAYEFTVTLDPADGKPH